MSRRISLLWLVLLALVVLAGVGLFLVFSRQAEPLVKPAGTAVRP